MNLTLCLIRGDFSRTKVLLGLVGALVALSSMSSVALAATPNYIPPPGISCTSHTDYPHASKHSGYTIVLTKGYLPSGCTVEVTKLTLTVRLILGSLQSGEQIASGSGTWFNTDGVGVTVYAQISCATYGNNTYSAETTGTFTYQGTQYPVNPYSQDNIYVGNCKT
jgi:hypothetical protein